MTRKKSRRGQGRREGTALKAKIARYVLKLYVTGATAASLRAIANVKAICEQYLRGHYDLEVTDIYQKSAELREDQIIAVPALVRKQPAPHRILVGDFSEARRVLHGLGFVIEASS